MMIKANMLFDVCPQIGLFFFFFRSHLLITLECLALFFPTPITIPSSSADWLQRARDVCAPGDTSQEHWLLVLPVLRPAVLRGRQFAQNKTNVMETVMQLLRTNRIPSILSSAVSGRARTHTRTSAVRAGAVHFRALTGGCGSYRDEWWLD